MGHLINVKRDVDVMLEKLYLVPIEHTKLMKSLRKINLLTPDFANTKTAKSMQFKDYVSYILHLSPADIAFKALGRKGTLCPMASLGCKAACLNTAGRGRFDSIQLYRLRKTLYFILFRDEFMSHLEKELTKLEIKASKNNKTLVVRLNGTSDIQWENIPFKSALGFNLFTWFTNIQFYDYTKIVSRLTKVAHIDNYYVVFSASETNDIDVTKALALGVNVAMVFNEIPVSWQGAKVISGDNHDFRFLDQGKGIIVGLKAKGKAKQDKSGFVRLTQCEMVA